MFGLGVVLVTETRAPFTDAINMIVHTNIDILWQKSSRRNSRVLVWYENQQAKTSFETKSVKSGNGVTLQDTSLYLYLC